MKFFVREVFDGNSEEYRKATVKPRTDIEKVLTLMGWVPLEVRDDSGGKKPDTFLGKFKNHIRAYNNWLSSTESLREGDFLFVQFPLWEHSFLMRFCLNKLKKRGVRIIFLIHDMDSLRWVKRSALPLKHRVRLWVEEKSCINCPDVIIAHNQVMEDLLIEKCGVARDKVVRLGIFDYLMDSPVEHKLSTSNSWRSIAIAGNLYSHKAGYTRVLPDNLSANLYGVGYDGKTSDSIQWHGSFPQDELPSVMQGGFGLVWDGDGLDGCTGVYGDYLRYNNPYKMSMYLACDLPVIIWEKAAQASFVKENMCGFTVNSVNEIKDILNQMNEFEYQMLKEHAQQIGIGLRSGTHTNAAIEESLRRIGAISEPVCCSREGGALWLISFRACSSADLRLTAAISERRAA